MVAHPRPCPHFSPPVQKLPCRVGRNFSLCDSGKILQGNFPLFGRRPSLGRQHCLHKHGIVIAKQKQGQGGVFPYQGQALISQFPHAAHQPANAQWKRCETVAAVMEAAS